MIEVTGSVANVLFEEAALLDGQQWEKWIELYTENCEFWMPMWKSEYELVSNPKTEVSLIYYNHRIGLEERVSRLNMINVPSANPLPRTQHNITNIMLTEENGHVFAKSNWSVNQYSFKTRRSELLFGRYEHKLIDGGTRWLIASKKIILLNEILPVLDIYNL
jgi:3-phenylpropionate/cinnamic acid dioxygenase small subunit